MTTPGQGGPGEEKRRGFSTLIRRATKVLKPNRASVSSIPTVASGSGTPSTSRPAPAPAATPSTSRAPAPSAAPATVSKPKETVAVAEPSTEVPSKSTADQITSAAAHSKLQEEKARAIFAKWGLVLEPGDWQPLPVRGDVEWVEKKVRMRVHRQCHRCQTTFGQDKICATCSHTRCKKCPRFPAKRTKEEAPVSGDERKPTLKTLSIPSKTGKADLVRNVPVQRVRRTCHKCEKLFVGKATQCENCKHARCPQCPRSPPKVKKWPNGYEGDVPETYPLAERTRKSIRLRTRWECHKCSTMFIEHEKVCKRCEHERCEQCTRHPPKKVKPPADENVLQSLESKLARASLSPAA